MSAFKTVIPINLEEVKKLLPPDSDVESVDWDDTRKEVTLKWSCRRWVTPFSFNEECSIEQLQSGEPPNSVTVRDVVIAGHVLQVEPKPIPAPMAEEITIPKQPVVEPVTLPPQEIVVDKASSKVRKAKPQQ